MGGDPQWLHDLANDFTIWSFDHGFWLGGGDGDWSVDSLRRIADREWQYEVDPTVTDPSELRAAAASVMGLTEDQVRKVTDQVPVEWRIPSRDLAGLAALLVDRAKAVGNRLQIVASSLDGGSTP